VAAVIAVVSPSGGEVGPFLPIEQAAPAQAAGDAGRTPAFARYDLVGSLAAAPTYLGLEGPAGYGRLVWAYAGAGLLRLGLFLRL
jgi:hypothetical protein